jgi:Ser-tRNA(Ala) deacylase AlaX
MNPVYRSSSYLKELQTTIQAVHTSETGQTALICLDQLFYSGGGGQPPDRGYVIIRDEQYPVHAFQKHKGDVLIVLDKKLPFQNEVKKGEPVLCVLDWERRYRMMKLHTAQHLLAASIRALEPTYHTHGMQISEEGEECAMRFFSQNAVSTQAIDLALESAYKAIESALSISANQHKSIEEARATYGLLFREPQYDLKGHVRVVVIDTVDANPCGGTHVRSLSEIERYEQVEYAPGTQTDEWQVKFK